MSWIEQKYISLLSYRLDKFKKSGRHNYNFRCPFCGDSDKSRKKARGYLLFDLDKNSYRFYCHNCFRSFPFFIFLKEMDQFIYDEYNVERLKERFGIKKPDQTEDFKSNVKKRFQKKQRRYSSILGLDDDHVARHYLESRQIPCEFFSELLYVKKFKEFVNTFIPDKFEEIKYDEPRIIIPFFDEDNTIYGFQGRALDSNAVRYITIMIDDSKPKVFNYYKCDKERQHFITEGAFDAMFLSNAMAMTGASIDYEFANKNSIFVFDNEPRAKDICKKIRKTISMGYKVAFFESRFKGKDINELVLHSWSPEYIEKSLLENTYQGLSAQMKFNDWRRI